MWKKKGAGAEGLQRFIGKTSVIAEGAELRGDLCFEGAVQVDGRVRGNLQASEGLVLISESGEVLGEVRAPRVVVLGRVQGDVHAAELLELGPTARVCGDLFYGVMEMAAGAHIDGRLCHAEKAPAPLELPAQLAAD